MTFGPLRRRSQEWGWHDPNPEAPPSDIDIEAPYYVNDETAGAAVYLLNDPKFLKKTTKWVTQRFKQTRNQDLIRRELQNSFMNELIDGVNMLASPYKDLAAISLEKIDWDALADPYIDPISGPQYMNEEDELENFEKALQMLPDEEDLPWLDESEYELLEQAKPPRKSPSKSPRITYDEQRPGYAPTHTW